MGQYRISFPILETILWISFKFNIRYLSQKLSPWFKFHYQYNIRIYKFQKKKSLEKFTKYWNTENS
jgi:hypothetical protein